MNQNEYNDGISINLLASLTGRELNEIKRFLRDLERAGFIEQSDWRKRYKITDEGIWRLNGKACFNENKDTFT